MKSPAVTVLISRRLPSLLFLCSRFVVNAKGSQRCRHLGHQAFSPQLVMAGYKRVANNPSAMPSAWEQCGLLDAFKMENQLEAALMADQLFKKDNSSEVFESEPSSTACDRLDANGNTKAATQVKRRNRPKGSKNKPKAASTVAAASTAAASTAAASTAAASTAAAASTDAAAASIPPVATKKRGRPAGSKNKSSKGTTLSKAETPITASRRKRRVQRLVHEDEQPVSPSELPAEFNDSSESESSSDANSDCIDLAQMQRTMLTLTLTTRTLVNHMTVSDA